MDIIEQRIKKQKGIVGNIERGLETAEYQVMMGKTELMLERAILITLEEQYGKFTGEAKKVKGK